MTRNWAVLIMTVERLGVPSIGGGFVLDRVDRESAAEAVREIILSIKPLEDGFDELRADAPLFDDGRGEASPVKLDSLDTLDAVTTIAEHFGLDDERLDEFLRGETDFDAFRTVNDIVDFVFSADPALKKAS